MSSKSKVIKGMKIAVCVLLILALVIVGVLFFPLTGKKHVQVWSAGDAFDLSTVQTVEKDRNDFKILMFTDTQLWKLCDQYNGKRRSRLFRIYAG